jgi:hypothetical protein
MQKAALMRLTCNHLPAAVAHYAGDDVLRT